jgi:hypothetical protein
MQDRTLPTVAGPQTSKAFDEGSPRMENVVAYLHARGLPKAQFVERHPHPFLVSYLEKDALETRRHGFLTEAVTRNQSRQYVEALRVMRSEGHQLRATAESLVIVPICKGPSRPFPERVTVGRTRQSDVTIADRRISKLHAYFETEHGGYVLTDAESRNGTKVGAEVLAAGQRREVRDGDVVSFADFVFRFISPERLYDEVRAYIVPIAGPTGGR